MNVVNVIAELTGKPEGNFLDLAKFNGATVGAVDISGESPVWEMHPDTDEFFYIVEGEFEITLLFDDGAERRVAPQGSLFVVPQGIWHKPAAPEGARFIYITPGTSLHSDAEDPRGDSA